MNRFHVLNILSLLFLITFNLLYIHKEPLYKDEQLKNMINYINLKIDKNAIIQTDNTINTSYYWISPLIRSLTKTNIFFDNSFPFNLEYAEDWLKRKTIIREIKKKISSNNYNFAICLLKKNKINYYISTEKFRLKDYKNIIYQNNKYIIYSLENNLNCKTILNQ